MVTEVVRITQSLSVSLRNYHSLLSVKATAGKVGTETQFSTLTNLLVLIKFESTAQICA
jgi:hypothetical protein